MRTNALRIEKLRLAVSGNCLPILNGRPVGLPHHLARLSGVAHSTIRHAYTKAGVKTYILDECVLFVDALDLITHFISAKPGRRSLN
jgi:hypothetical protein